MTTTVTIKTYSYPTLVETLKVPHNNPQGNWQDPVVVPAQSTQDFTLCSGFQFKLTELPASPTIE